MHQKSGHPYLTQDGKDREQGSDQYIANMCDGAVAGFKYFDLRETSKVRINIKGKATGVVYVSTEEGGQASGRDSGKTLQGTARFCS